MSFCRLLCLLSVAVAVANAQVGPAVFAHVIVGNTAAYDVAQWQTEIGVAQEATIDGFALNIGTPLAGTTQTQIANAFAAAAAQPGDFKLFFSFDYLGGADGPWAASDVISILSQYGGNAAHYKVNGQPLVSTFEGTGNTGDWSSIASSVNGGIYFMPDWTSLGPGGIGQYSDIIQGAFSWDMWPDGPNNITDDSDKAWQSALGSKSFMMGVSPWFYTDLPGYDKAWVWRGDDMWHTRWMQTLDVKPQFVEIVTWNDYGESHYINDIYEAGIPYDNEGNSAAAYVNGFPHAGWRSLLPYYIAMYKNNAPPSVSDEIIQYWYRLAPVASGQTNGTTGNDCPSSINGASAPQSCYPVDDILEDAVFFTALVGSLPADITFAIGDAQPESIAATQVGLNHFSRAFNGQTGNVTVAISRNGADVVSSTGPAIAESWPNDVAIYNAWVGTASTADGANARRGLQWRR
ncbi:MAG: hypothetical protein M1822_004953 [Bathelium mastoideum]|nr:MAG: hypothetical protein M1822_004953 [Bathelium mastoideum]